MTIGTLHLRIRIPGCQSLKEKRGYLKPLLIRLRREFNVAAAEIGLQDVWQTAEIGLVTLSNDRDNVQRTLQAVPGWIERHWPMLTVDDETIEIL